MFKRFMSMALVLVAVLSLAACGGKGNKERTYAADGSYTAFLYETRSNNTPQITSVTVVIENDAIKSYTIDCTQGYVTKDSEGAVTGALFNEQSKKELGYNYKMHYGALEATDMDDYKNKLAESGKLEWFEQAAAIEAHWLANGVDSVEVTDGVISNVANVTIKDGGYTALAKEAVANAKAGIVKSFALNSSYGKAQVVFATAKVVNGKLTDVVLDTIQSNVTDGKWSFNAQTKQELGYGYKMHYYSLGATDMDDYKNKLAESGKLEWFEQAALIVEAFVAGQQLTVDETGHFSNIAGVSINDDGYSTVLAGLKACVK